MNKSEIKKLIIESLSPEGDQKIASERLAKEGILFDFNEGFKDKVLDNLFSTGITLTREVEYIKSMNFAFYRIALTGAAAIVILLISIFLMEGSLSLNSFFGLSDNYNESIVCLLTGN